MDGLGQMVEKGGGQDELGKGEGGNFRWVVKQTNKKLIKHLRIYVKNKMASIKSEMEVDVGDTCNFYMLISLVDKIGVKNQGR